MLKKIVFYLWLFLAVNAGQAFADSLLVDWLFNDNGYIYDTSSGVDEFPDYYNFSNFDWETGLGSITITYDSAGDYSLISFFDYEFSEGQNSYYNEYGEVFGLPDDLQTWEIDEPGYVFGDIYDNALSGLLDNSNEIPLGLEDDVSIALGWGFLLQDNETAIITLTVSEDILNGFYLTQTDLDTEEVLYFSSDLNIFSNTTPVPEPSCLVLFGGGMICFVAFRSKIFNRKSLFCGNS